VEEPIWVKLESVLEIHKILVEESEYDEFLTLNYGLLESTLARPKNLFYYGENVTLFELAAAYGYGFTKNHCFTSANKRVALVITDNFLQLNGYELIASENDFFKTIVDIAENKIDQDSFAKWIALRSKIFILTEDTTIS
jgi:death-on-curing protein